jgi:NADP-dependent 3-hydroxy acid dehydrogenase YdfG
MDNVLTRKLETKDADDIRKILADIIQSPVKTDFNFLRQITLHFKARKAGKIINIISINGLCGKFGQTD